VSWNRQLWQFDKGRLYIAERKREKDSLMRSWHLMNRSCTAHGGTDKVHATQIRLGVHCGAQKLVLHGRGARTAYEVARVLLPLLLTLRAYAYDCGMKTSGFDSEDVHRLGTRSRAGSK
jgi:hypothetical protein